MSSPVTAAAYALAAPAGTMHVRKTTFQRVSLDDLRPGDIGFQYQPKNRNFRQFWITVGGTLCNLWRKKSCDPYVVHSFIVVKGDAAHNQLRTVDGAGNAYRNIDEVCMDFNSGAHVPPHAEYFFYRPVDPQMGPRVVQIARNWASPGEHNFSIRQASVSPFHKTRFGPKAQATTLSLFAQSNTKAPPKTAPGGAKVQKMMCSGFVISVCQAATLSLYRERAGAAQGGESLLKGLRHGPQGKLFAVDPAGSNPPFIQARLEGSAYWRPVGFVTNKG
jgi:hypothetical protein